MTTTLSYLLLRARKSLVYYVSVPFILLVFFNNSFSQNTSGTEFKINLQDLGVKLQNSNALNEANLPVIDFPLPNGKSITYRVKIAPLSKDQPVDVKTYSGQSLDNNAKIRFAITPSGGFSAIIHSENVYYFIEVVDKESGTYKVYSMNDAANGTCDNQEEAQSFGRLPVKNGRVLSISPFPVGSQLRSYRMAAAATGEMFLTYTTQVAAKDKIVAIMNAINLIYELEASITFSLISKTTTSPYPLVFTVPGTDPFTVDTLFARANNSQVGYNTMNGNATLLYSEYDVAHTFNAYNPSNSATWGGKSLLPTYYVRGQAGGVPCTNSSKATGWTEFLNNADLGSVVKVTAHEIAHQFSVGHTYNAVGGSVSSPTFCTAGWNSQSAVEPGTGSTLMGYNGNCSYPVNYVLTSPNFLSVFHTKSLEQMFTAVNTSSTCFTGTATGNAVPVANAGADYIIPKGTPFTLTGTATDASSPADILSYAWDQNDVATANDQAAFGSNVTGTGGYTAVNSPASAPLFRSKILSVPSRTFPALSFILNNANNPADNEGEDLPQVARTMKFRFTVRDNHSGGGGVDSDDANITVDSKGPFLIASQNTMS